MYDGGILEVSHSGLVRSLGKRVFRKVSRVRIPPPPQKVNMSPSYKGFIGVTRALYKL